MILVTIPEALWAASMLPQGILERWLVGEGAPVAVGEALAVVRIEDALHELLSPARGILRRDAAAGSVIDPGAEIGRITD